MAIETAIQDAISGLPEERQRIVLEFARFVASATDAAQFGAFGRAQLEKAYGPDEPEYTEADLLPDKDE